MVNMKQVEKCIFQVGSEFSSATVNFRSEGNFKCLLFNYLRALPNVRIPSQTNTTEIELAHAEFPAATSSREHYDLVILTPNSAKIFARDYGVQVGSWSKKMRFMCVLEVKFRSADPRYDPKIKKDIDRLSNIIKAGISRNSCFIIFIDKDVDWDINPTYQKLRKRFEGVTRRYRQLKVYCIPGKSGDVICIERGAATTIDVSRRHLTSW